MYGYRRRLSPEQKAANAAARAEKDARRCECQVCERMQMADRRARLVNHGYTRPGYGWLVGGCYGVGCEPFPATDALERYLPGVVAYAEAQERLAEQPEAITFRIAYDYTRRREITTTIPANLEAYGLRVEALSCELHAYEEPWYNRNDWPYSPEAKAEKFAELLKRTKAAHASHAKHARFEQARVEARITKGRSVREAARETERLGIPK